MRAKRSVVPLQLSLLCRVVPTKHSVSKIAAEVSNDMLGPEEVGYSIDSASDAFSQDLSAQDTLRSSLIESGEPDLQNLSVDLYDQLDQQKQLPSMKEWVNTLAFPPDIQEAVHLKLIKHGYVSMRHLVATPDDELQALADELGLRFGYKQQFLERVRNTKREFESKLSVSIQRHNKKTRFGNG